MTLDVVVPVYEGLDATRRCLESVRRTTHGASCELVVIDDASPNPEIRRYLEALAADGVTVLRNEANTGFVRSANRGLALHTDRDVVLLNSDTEVANDWVARLRAAAYSAANVATATPFSNNATICSYPFEEWTGGVPGTLGVEALDRVVAAANRGVTHVIPTGVGFCMYMRRACVEQVGPFDAERFGRGYGEENDFCMRAGKAGWRNVLAADVFVFHEGGVSFARERTGLLEVADRTLLELHPEYPQLVREFIERDPLAGLREAIDRARAQCDPEEAAAVVHERAEERAWILRKLRAVEAVVGEHESHMRRLHEGLAEATRIVEERSEKLAERERALHERDEEIARLHEGLRHAEKLAVERLAELERIRGFWMWRFYSRALQYSGTPEAK